MEFMAKESVDDRPALAPERRKNDRRQGDRRSINDRRSGDRRKSGGRKLIK